MAAPGRGTIEPFMLALSPELASGDQHDLDDGCFGDDDHFEPIFIGEDFNLYVWFASGEPFAGEHPIAKIGAGGAIEYYLQDSMGSVIGGVDASGALSASVKYDSFGDVTSATGTAASSSNVGGDFRLHGMWLDDVSGLYHVRARTYDAATGRFLSRDPVAGVMGRPESMTPYVMGHSNLMVWRDPSGRFSLIELSVVTAISGILAAVALPAFQGYLGLARTFRTASFLDAGGDLGRQARESLARDLASFSATADPRQIPLWFMQGLSTAAAYIAHNHFAYGLDAHVSAVTPLSDSGTIAGVNHMWNVAGEGEYSAYCYRSEDEEGREGRQLGLDVGAAAQVVLAWGDGPWTGKFHAGAGGYLNGTGSFFWSPDFSWFGITLGVAVGLPAGLAGETTNYVECPHF